MRKYFILLFYTLISAHTSSFGQDKYIYSKEGRPVLRRTQLISSCLKSLHKDIRDKTALSICECELDKIDGHFTNKQYRKYSGSGLIDISGMIKEDTLLDKKIQACYTNSGQTTLLQAEGFENEFITDCIESIQKNTEKTLDINRLTSFCGCQHNLVKTKRISDQEMKTIADPNSLLFYEMMYKCGDPFMGKDVSDKNWDKDALKDVNGPVSDTIRILSLNGMTYLKIKIGSMTQIWLFDTGATDMLINKDMEKTFMDEHIITGANYIGIGEYEMANGMIDTCRKYRIDSIQVGHYLVNNIVVAVTDKGKRIIAGKALLNKFSKWILNNEDNTLILSK